MKLYHKIILIIHIVAFIYDKESLVTFVFGSLTMIFVGYGVIFQRKRNE